jgi:hypothetical protein
MSTTITVAAIDGQRVRIDVDSIKGTKGYAMHGGRAHHTDITYEHPDGQLRLVRIAEREVRFLDLVRRLKRCTAKPDNSP